MSKVIRYNDADTGKAHTFWSGGPGYDKKRSAITNPIYVILRKDQPKWAGFSFMPKGEVV